MLIRLVGIWLGMCRVWVAELPAACTLPMNRDFQDSDFSGSFAGLMHFFHFATLRHGSTVLFLGMIVMAGPAWSQTQERTLTPGEVAANPALTAGERVQALVTLSARLVQQAESGKAHASTFRIDVAYYRETLRDLVRDNDQRLEKDRIERALLMNMVRITALLQSAAQCQTGRYIVCPPDLMTQLHRQQALVEQGLALPGTKR